MPSAEEIISALFPRTTAAYGSSFPRRAFAGAMDAASFPGRAIAAGVNASQPTPTLADIIANPSRPANSTDFLTSLRQTQAAPGDTRFNTITENLFRDPSSIIGPGAGELGASLAARGVSKLAPGLLARALPYASDAAVNAGTNAATQYGEMGQVNPLGMALGTGMGLGMQGLGSVAAQMAPKGRAAIMENPNFRKWFGDSKVLDEAGNPLTVYHGTDADFNEFKPNFAGSKTNDESGYVEWSKVGPNFTTSPKYASDHAEGLGVGSVIPAHVKIKNPYEITERDWSSILKEMESGDLTSSDFRDQLVGDGYDGILLHAKDNGINSMHVIPFDPTQIKSATGNRGTFDPNDPNITHFAGGQSPIAGANALAGRYLRGLLNQKEEDLR
jgi:hypothetical protein